MKWIKYSEQKPEPGQWCYTISQTQKNIARYEEYTTYGGDKNADFSDELFGCPCCQGGFIYWFPVNKLEDITNPPDFPEGYK